MAKGFESQISQDKRNSYVLYLNHLCVHFILLLVLESGLFEVVLGNVKIGHFVKRIFIALGFY